MGEGVELPNLPSEMGTPVHQKDALAYLTDVELTQQRISTPTDEADDQTPS